jgi:hypothetical protein
VLRFPLDFHSFFLFLTSMQLLRIPVVCAQDAPCFQQELLGPGCPRLIATQGHALGDPKDHPSSPSWLVLVSIRRLTLSLPGISSGPVLPNFRPAALSLPLPGRRVLQGKGPCCLCRPHALAHLPPSSQAPFGM